MHSNILLTGRPGIGKSTAIKHIIEKLGADECGGFWSREIRQHGSRVGFAIVTLNGEKGILAHVKYDSGPRVSKYRVNLEDIDNIAVPAMERARSAGKIIIIDEIAKMELFSESFKEEVLRCLDTRKVIGTIQKRHSTFLDSIRARNDVRTIEINETNRDRIPVEVLSSTDLT